MGKNIVHVFVCGDQETEGWKIHLVMTDHGIAALVVEIDDELCQIVPINEREGSHGQLE